MLETLAMTQLVGNRCPKCSGTVYLDGDCEAPALVCRQAGHRWFINRDGTPYHALNYSEYIKRPWALHNKEFDGMQGKQTLPPTVSLPSTWSRPRHKLG